MNNTTTNKNNKMFRTTQEHFFLTLLFRFIFINMTDIYTKFNGMLCGKEKCEAIQKLKYKTKEAKKGEDKRERKKINNKRKKTS